MLFASLLFACMGVCVKLVAETHGAAEIVFYRSVVSLAFMFAIVRWRKVSLVTPHWKLQFFRGASGFVSLLLYFYAIAMLPLATAVTLNYTSPIFLVAYLVIFGQLKMNGRMVGAVLLGFVGVALLLKPTLAASQWLGGMIGLASGALAGLAYFNVRALGELGEPEPRTVFYFSLLSSVGAILWLALVGGLNFTPLDARSAALMLGTGLFATLAQLAMTRSYRHGNPIVSASLAYSAVIFASLFGVWFWGEHLGLDAGLAILLIVGGGIAASLLARRKPADVINPAEQD